MLRTVNMASITNYTGGNMSSGTNYIASNMSSVTNHISKNVKHFFDLNSRQNLSNVFITMLVLPPIQEM